MHAILRHSSSRSSVFAVDHFLRRDGACQVLVVRDQVARLILAMQLLRRIAEFINNVIAGSVSAKPRMLRRRQMSVRPVPNLQSKAGLTHGLFAEISAGFRFTK